MIFSLRQISVITVFILTLIINWLANYLPLNGQLTGEISDRFPVFFVPAGYVFAIWGVIYLLLLGFAWYQSLPRQRDNKRLDQVGWLFVTNGLANSLWLILWHYNYFSASFFAMVTVLVTLILIYLTAEIGREKVNRRDLWFVHIPFSVYLGWISVATIANTSVVLYSLSWNQFGLSAQTWTVIMLIVVTALTVSMILIRKDFAYYFVIIWALVGILVKFPGEEMIKYGIFFAAGVPTLFVLRKLLSKPSADSRKTNQGV